MEKEKPRIIMAKLGLDGHDLGVRLTSNFLREAGMEVIYLGLHNTPEGLVRAAIDEDVDLIGLSFLSGNYFVHIQRVMDLLKERNRTDIPVVLGGVIPRRDFDALKQIGIREIYEGAWPISNVISSIKGIIAQKHK